MENFLKREQARSNAKQREANAQIEHKNNAFTGAKKDCFNSTFIYKIKFENGKIITGYSANAGFSERNDKNAVLINYTLRMYKRGYLDYDNPPKDRILYLDIFLNLVSGEKQIFRLYYEYYECFDSFEDFKIFCNFLDNFYIEVEKNTPAEKIFSMFYRNEKTKTIEPLDFSFKRFITKKSLYNYCNIMIDKKVFSREQANYFYDNYLLKHNLNF